MDNYEAIQNPPLDEVLLHYGILGMHWGVRRYQNPDGSLTPAGVARAKKIALQKDKVQEARAKRKARMEAKLAKKERKAQEKFIKNRNKILQDPDKLYKHLAQFKPEEIDAALRFYEQRSKVHDAKRTKLGQAKRYADTLLSYGNTINNTISFLNSDVGRGIRGKLGLSTAKICDFSYQDKEKSRREDFYLDQKYPKNKGKNNKQQDLKDALKEIILDDDEKRKIDE